MFVPSPNTDTAALAAALAMAVRGPWQWHRGTAKNLKGYGRRPRYTGATKPLPSKPCERSAWRARSQRDLASRTLRLQTARHPTWQRPLEADGSGRGRGVQAAAPFRSRAGTSRLARALLARDRSSAAGYRAGRDL